MALFPESLTQRLRRTGVLATLIIDEAQDAVPLARALQAGGLDCLELTLRTEAALEAIRRVRAEAPEVLVGAGTILTPEQARACAEAGAAFGVAPGVNRRVIAAAQEAGLPFAPGVCTPSDIEQALEAECRLLKFFPCGPCGGLPYLRAMAAPYLHLGVRFIPLGGIGAGHAGEYLAEPLVLALGGSWLAPREIVQRRDWPALTTIAQQAAEAVRRVRP